jgi:hypothetical protein
MPAHTGQMGKRSPVAHLLPHARAALIATLSPRPPITSHQPPATDLMCNCAKCHRCGGPAKATMNGRPVCLPCMKKAQGK